MTHLKSIASIFSFALPAAFAIYSNLLYIAGLVCIVIWISCKVLDKCRRVQFLTDRLRQLSN